jgi:hypothetical protein
MTGTKLSLVLMCTFVVTEIVEITKIVHITNI